jgi:uncharacterized membrane protein
VIWFLLYLVAVELMGLALLPLAVRLFRPLADRGVLFAKPLGILLIGYSCWLLGTLGMLRSQQATIALLVVLAGAASWLTWGRECLSWLRGHARVVVAMEMVFLLSFAAAALVRAYNPEISGTEKPMDFAILNALYRTEQFPAADPWMSGFSISYYYFGYLLLALVAKFAGVPAAAGYNLAVALVFALLLAGCYSVTFNLFSGLRSGWSLTRRLLLALVAPLMIGLMGNLEIGFEVLAARGIGDSAFWNWVGVKGIQPAVDSQGWLPTAHWWWWRASRVVPTIKPDGITEFPYFSFILGDLHPHFTALPWGLLALSLSLSALLGRGARWTGRLLTRTGGRDAGDAAGEDGNHPDPETAATDYETEAVLADLGAEAPARVAGGSQASATATKGWVREEWLEIVLPALALGFLMVGNSWDFPTYTGLFWLSVLVPIGAEDWKRPVLLAKVKKLLLTSVLSLVLYAPFFPGFSSQTKGIGLSTDKTPWISMMILFGTFLVVQAVFLLWKNWPATGDRPAAESATLWAIWGVGAGLLVLSPLLGSGALILGFVVLAGGLARRWLSAGEKVNGREAAARRFMALLLVASFLLIVGPEFVFIVDLFGTRMNTVFKFQYQAWLLLGVGSAVALGWVATELRPALLRWAAVICTALLVGVGLLYPLTSTPSKAEEFRGSPTLDGAVFYQNVRPDDYEAIQWLARTSVGRPVVLEATGGDYSEYARVSTFSGLPSVLGWGGHEVQWRGRGEESQRRTADIDSIYQGADRAAIRGILDRYAVQYVFVGSLEFDKYGPAVANRFDGVLEPVHRQGRVTVYRVPGM